MLPLDDERWSQLTTFFGQPENLPNVLGRWLASIGLDEEDTIYRRDLFDVFLHQNTITNAAFAVVPWLVHVCHKRQTKYAVEYLTDVACVEANRLKFGVYGNRKGTEEYPEWLMAEYKKAIVDSRSLVGDAIEAEQNDERKSGLVAMKPALYGDGNLAWHQWNPEKWDSEGRERA